MKTLIVYGPTATGKTALALSLAKKYGGEIISADSRQVFTGLDIGSGKVSFEDTFVKGNGCWNVNGVKIYGFDLCPPGENFTVADFIKSTITSIKKIKHDGKLPIIVGGTGFYIKVLLNGLQSYGIPADEKLRAKLNKLTKEQLALQLKEIDQRKLDSMNFSDKNNPRRLARAIEIALSTQSGKGIKPFITNTHLIGLTAANPYLYQKSDSWLETRLKHGLIEEVESLLKSKVDALWLEKLGLEYRWITFYLTGKLSYDKAILGLKGDTHDFIRRQKNWFKQYEGIKIYNVQKSNFAKLIGKDLLI